MTVEAFCTVTAGLTFGTFLFSFVFSNQIKAAFATIGTTFGVDFVLFALLLSSALFGRYADTGLIANEVY